MDKFEIKENRKAHEGTMYTPANIGPRERKVRLVAGLLFSTASVLLSLFYVISGMTNTWLIIIYVLYYQGSRFLLDYRTGTCPLKAELGQQKMDAWFSVTGSKIEDITKVRKIKNISRKALFIALFIAAAATVLTYLLRFYYPLEPVI